MIEDLFFLEKQTYKKSIIHDLDARVKIVVSFAAIVAMVAVPYSPLVMPVAVAFAIFFAGIGLSPASRPWSTPGGSPWSSLSASSSS